MTIFGSRNKNRFRRVVGYEKTKPITVYVTDSNGIVGSYDAGSVAAHYDFYLIPTIISAQTVVSSAAPISYSSGLYDEGFFDLSGSTSGRIEYNFVFPNGQIPIVTLTVEATGGYENIIAYATQVTEEFVDYQLSAPHSGNVRYRAIYASSYPTIVQRNVAEPSLYYTASAGRIFVTQSQQYSGTFPSLGGTPTAVFLTNLDSNSNSDVNTAYIDETNDSTSLSGYLSDYITNTINFIVVK